MQPFPENVRRLVGQFEASKNRSASASQRSATRAGVDSIEAQIRHDYLDPLFEALGWDLHNQHSDRREVIVEYDITPGSREKVDYCFRVDGVPVFFVEAKASWENLDYHFEQIKWYSEEGRMPLVILTNFQELRIYAQGVRSVVSRRNRTGLSEIGRLTYDLYERHWAQLAAILSPSAVRRGSIANILHRIKSSEAKVNVFAETSPSVHVQQVLFPQSDAPSGSVPYMYANPQSYGQPHLSQRGGPGRAAVGSKIPFLIATAGALMALLLVGTCVVMMAGTSRSDAGPKPASWPPAKTPPHAGEIPSVRKCPLVPWDGAVRGWAKLGQCGPGVETGYYLRVASNQSEASSRSAIAEAWGRYLTTYASGTACPSAKEMMFFDNNGESGAGILFAQRPQAWERVVQTEPQWLLADAKHQPVTAQVCFFIADESRRPAGWSR